jgi:hypothetical protein
MRVRSEYGLVWSVRIVGLLVLICLLIAGGDLHLFVLSEFSCGWFMCGRWVGSLG